MKGHTVLESADIVETFLLIVGWVMESNTPIKAQYQKIHIITEASSST